MPGRSVLGNLHDAPLAEICNGETLQALRRESLEGRLGCYEKCTLLDKNELVPVEMPRVIDYASVKRLKIMFGEGCNIGLRHVPAGPQAPRLSRRGPAGRKRSISRRWRASSSRAATAVHRAGPQVLRSCRVPQGKQVSFLTNGVLVSEQWADRIALHSGFVYFSLNAATKPTHERVNKGSKWENVLRNVQRVRAAGERHRHRCAHPGPHDDQIRRTPGKCRSSSQSTAEFGFDAIDFGYDWAMPKYLKSKVGFFERRKLKRERPRGAGRRARRPPSRNTGCATWGWCSDSARLLLKQDALGQISGTRPCFWGRTFYGADYDVFGKRA